MKISKNKFLVKLIASLCVFLTLINFGVLNNKVYAVDDEIWGGLLIQPIIELVVAIADGAVDLLQNALLSSGKVQINSLIKIEGGIDPAAETVLAIMVIFAFLIIAVAVIAVGGFAGVVAATLTKVAIGTAFVVKLAAVAVVAGVISGVCVAKKYSGDWFPPDLYLPTYKVTAQEIFSNELSIFDVNFFNPKPNSNVQVVKTIEKIESIWSESYIFSQSDIDNNTRPGWADKANGDIGDLLIMLDRRFINEETNKEFESQLELEQFDWSKYEDNIGIQKFSDSPDSAPLKYIVKKIDANRKENSEGINIRSDAYLFTGKVYVQNNESTTIAYYNIRIKCFDKWKFMVKYNYNMATNDANVEIFEIIESEDKLIDVEMESTAKQLREVISKWYFVLRNLALLVLMLILIYTGIRITIGSTAGEKAKYKERLIDWLVALCLVMIMHYIMVFAIELVEKITELVKSSTGQDAYVNMIEITEDKRTPIENYDKDGIKLKELIESDKEAGIDYLAWPTDLMGQMRIEAQTVSEGTARWAAYSIAFVILVFFTIFFVWTYLKRVVYMAFLTMIAPLVAMTYPIDKMTDGKAQAFNAWLKEYMFNLLIQPMHLLLYTILVTSAFELASKNALYTIVAVGFMMPAEKLLRKLFGFEKAQTPGLLGGAAGAALAMTGIQSLIQHHPTGNGGAREKDEDSREDKNDIRFSSSNGVSAVNNAVENINLETGKPTGEININIRTNQQQKEEKSSGSTAVNPGNVRNQNSGETTQRNQISKRNSKGVQISFVNTQSNNQEDKKKDKKVKKKRALRTMRAVIGSYARGQGNKAWKRVKNGHPIKSLVKGTVGLAGAATLGTLGLALGIASGDPSKVFKYTTTTVAGGYALGKGVTGSVTDALTVDGDEIKDDAELAWYGDDYKKAKLSEQKDEFIKDENNVSYLRKTLGITRKEAKKILSEEGSICLNSGISEVEDVAAIHEMVKEQGYNIKDAISMKKFSDRLPDDINKMAASKIEGHRKQFQTEIEDKLRTEVKGELVDKIKGEHEEKIRDDIIRQLREKNENVETEEAKQRIEQLTNENIEQYAEQKISEQAKAKSEEIILGMVDFSNAKAALREA